MRLRNAQTVNRPRSVRANEKSKRCSTIFVAAGSHFPLDSEMANSNPTSPNHALQRTAPGVTLAAADRPATCAHPAPAALPQPARRAPQSLSLGSFGDFSRFPRERRLARVSRDSSAFFPEQRFSRQSSSAIAAASVSACPHFDTLFPAGLSSFAAPPRSTRRRFSLLLISMPLSFQRFGSTAVSPAAPNGQRRRTRRCSELLRSVTPAAPAACAPSHLSAAGAPALRSR